MTGEQGWQPPLWLRRLGVASWLLVGIVVVVFLVFWAFRASATISIPLLFAALLGAVFMPLVDRLESWRLPRWIASLLILALIVAGLAAILVVVTRGVIGEAAAIWSHVDDGLAALRSELQKADLDPKLVDQAHSSFAKVGAKLAGGLVALLPKGVQSVASLVFSAFIALNILYFMLHDGRRIADWLGKHLGVPESVARPSLTAAVRSLRGYIWGVSIVSAFNAAVVTTGAIILGTPLAATIGIVTFFTAYIPYFGAIIASVFAVLVAFGSGGFEDAVLMLIVVLVAQGPLQNVVTQFAVGGSLKLHPLVVLLSTTLGGVAAGVIGATFAAPLTAVAIDVVHRIDAAGLFSEDGDHGGRSTGDDAVLDAIGATGPPPPTDPDAAPA